MAPSSVHLLQHGLQETLQYTLCPAVVSLITGCVEQALGVPLAATSLVHSRRKYVSEPLDSQCREEKSHLPSRLIPIVEPASRSGCKGMVALGIDIVRRGRRLKRKGILGNFQKADNQCGSGCCCETDPLKDFTSVLATARMDLIPAYACRVRRQAMSENSQTSIEALDYACCASNTTMEGPPMCGSFNVVFPILFGDGVCWIIKIPAAGTDESWGPSAAAALTSEASTMRMLKKSTSIPVPAVHAFSSSIDNELGCPFILMDHLEGTPLYLAWWDDDAVGGPEALEKFRLQSLKTLAESMAELHTFSFEKSGSPVYDEVGHIRSTGPARTYDAPARFNVMYSDRPDDHMPFFDLGPCDNVQDFFLTLLKRHREKKDPFSRGLDKMLRLFIEWLPDMRTDLPFGLSHLDCDLQNILVKEDGSICGLIDWDGVAAVPHSVGCQSLPKFLIRDWDLFFYNWDFDANRINDDDERDENSPEELARYRGVYAQAMESCLTAKHHRTPDLGNSVVDRNKSRMTRQSLLIGSLYTAVREPLSTTKILFDIFDKIEAITDNRPIVPTSELIQESRIAETDNTRIEKLHQGPEELEKTYNVSDADEDLKPNTEEALGLNDLHNFPWIAHCTTAQSTRKAEDSEEHDDIDMNQHEPPTIEEDTMPGIGEFNQYDQIQKYLAQYRETKPPSVRKRTAIWAKKQKTRLGSLVSRTSSRISNGSLVSKASSLLSSGHHSHKGSSEGLPTPPTTDSTTHTMREPDGKCLPHWRLQSKSSPSSSSMSDTRPSMAGGANTELPIPSDSGYQSDTPQNRTAKPSNSPTNEAEETVSNHPLDSTLEGIDLAPSPSSHKVVVENRVDEPREGLESTPPIMTQHTISNDLLENTLDDVAPQSTSHKKSKQGRRQRAKRFLAKLNPCKSKIADHSGRTETPDTKEPSPCPVSPEIRQERIAVLERAAKQKFPNEIVSVRSSPEATPEPESSPPAPSTGAGQNDAAPTVERYVDKGFNDVYVSFALANGELDEARMRRLKDGFYMLLNRREETEILEGEGGRSLRRKPLEG